MTQVWKYRIKFGTCRSSFIERRRTKAHVREPATKPVGKPDAGNPHVRFDERGREKGRSSKISTRARPRLYRRSSSWRRRFKKPAPVSDRSGSAGDLVAGLSPGAGGSRNARPFQTAAVAPAIFVAGLSPGGRRFRKRAPASDRAAVAPAIFVAGDYCAVSENSITFSV